MSLQVIGPERPRKEHPARRGGPGRCWHTDRDLDRILEIQPMHNRTNPPGVGTVQPASSSPPACIRFPQAGVPSPSRSPWARYEPDPERVLAELRVRNPAVVAWWGDWTGSYWHLDQAPDGTFRLLEAATAEELHAQVAPLARRPALHPAWASVPQPLVAVPLRRSYTAGSNSSARPVPTLRIGGVLGAAPEVRRRVFFRLWSAVTRRSVETRPCREACCVPPQRGRQDGWGGSC